jgi:tight adherence protein B
VSAAAVAFALLSLAALWSAAHARRRGRPLAPRSGRMAGTGRRRILRARSPSGTRLPETVEAIAAALGAGRSLVDGFALAADASEDPLATELRAAVTRIERGMAISTAVDRWAARSRSPGAGLVAAAIGLTGDAGGDLGQALAGVAATLREHRSLEREIRALSSQARASAAVIAVAPAGFTAVAAVLDPATGGFLVASPAGWACLAAGAALDLAGWRWMDALVRSVR